MITRLAEKCRSVQQELENGILVKPGRINDLEVGIFQELEKIGANDSPESLRAIKEAVLTLALQARILRARVEALESTDNAVEFHEMSQQMAQIERKVASSGDYEQAVIEIEREMHESKGTFRDILKSLLMWKEAPDEKLGTAPKF